MLKGIKSSKTTSLLQGTQEEQILNGRKEKEINSINEINQDEIKIFSSNGQTIKQKFIIEQERSNNQDAMDTLIENSLEICQQKLKEKALEILSLYKQGRTHQLKNSLKIFEKAELKFKSMQKKSQQAIFLSEIEPKSRNIISKESKETNERGQKGRFQYGFNYDQAEKQRHLDPEKSLKRSSKVRSIMKSQKIQDYCIYCPDNQQLKLISASNFVYLSLPKKKTFQKYWHFILAPVEHQQSTIGLNQEVLTQLSNYKKCLLQMFDQKNFLVVFWQQFSQQNSHIYIECLAVPYSKGQDFPFFFKQSLETVQGNWTTHHSIIKIEKQKGGLQKQIPKKIKYFYIDFSLGYGYAHVIENQQFWIRNFCYDIIATALGIQLYEVKTAAEFTEEELKLKEQQFKLMWQPYDWTKLI